jgi:methyl-accepting chemotaxis protein
MFNKSIAALRGRRVSLTVKIALAMALAAMVPTVTATVLASAAVSDSLVEAAGDGLFGVAESRTDTITRYSETIAKQVITVAATTQTRDALDAFTESYTETGADAVRSAYVGSLGETADAGDGSAWSADSAKHHPWFRQFQVEFDYYDVFLFDTTGDLVYTVFKEDDFGNNFYDGPYADSGLGEVFQQAAQLPAGEVYWTDFEPYAPSNGDPAAFIAAPVYRDTDLLGVLAFQMPLDQIAAIMQSTTGLGETGEAYLVGDDGLMRTQSRLSTENTILETNVETDEVGRAIAGESGVEIETNNRGVEVLSAYGPVEVFGHRYAMIAEIETGEALASAGALTRQLALTTLALVVLLMVFGVWFARRLGKPIKTVSEASKRLATGDTAIALDVSRNDELGDMVEAFEGTIQYLAYAAESAESVAGGDLRVEHQPVGESDTLGHALARMVTALRQVVGDARTVAGNVDSASNSVSGSSRESAQVAEEVATAISSVAEAATSQANISDSLLQAVDRISKEVEMASEASQSVVDASTTARGEATTGLDLINQATRAMEAITNAFGEVSESVTTLDGQFVQVEEIVDLIRSIAEQTNLLALNAAIEAARAGELGRGFAVVASEVKSLAEESASSTERIASIVGDMKSGVATTVRSANDGRTQIESGSSVVSSAGESFRTIAASVEEIDGRAHHVQSATGRIEDAAGRIASDTKELAALAQSNSAVAEEVAASSEEATAAATELGGQAGELSGSSAQLIATLDRFTID